MVTLRLLIVLVVAAPLAYGCSDPSSLPTSPSSASGGGEALTADSLDGTWQLVSIQPSSENVQPTPAGTAYTLAFTNDRVSTRADCNTCAGTFALAGQTLTVGPLLACTRAACRTAEFESAYTSLLAGDSTIARAGDALVLTSERGTLRFGR
jgi:heat shock protein HslJ